MSMSFVNPIKMAEDDDNEAGEKKGANKKLDATKKVAIGGNTDNLFLNLADKTMQDDLNRSLITKVLQVSSASPPSPPPPPSSPPSPP